MSVAFGFTKHYRAVVTNQIEMNWPASTLAQREARALLERMATDPGSFDTSEGWETEHGSEYVCALRITKCPGAAEFLNPGSGPRLKLRMGGVERIIFSGFTQEELRRALRTTWVPFFPDAREVCIEGISMQEFAFEPAWLAPSFFMGAWGLSVVYNDEARDYVYELDVLDEHLGTPWPRLQDLLI